MKALMTGYALSLIGGVLTFALAPHSGLAPVISMGGVVITQLGVLVWVALYDSRKRWPQVKSAWARAGYVLTFSSPKEHP